MDASDLVIHTAVHLASADAETGQAQALLIRAARRDRLTLDVARASILREGLPRSSATVKAGTGHASLRRRALELIEGAIARTRDGEGSDYTWNEVTFDTFELTA